MLHVQRPTLGTIASAARWVRFNFVASCYTSVAFPFGCIVDHINVQFRCIALHARSVSASFGNCWRWLRFCVVASCCTTM